MKPLGDYILVELIEESNKTESGIIIAGKQENSMTTGKVVATGSLALAVNVGDVVLFSQYAGVAINNEQHILKINDVVAIMDN